MTNEEAKEIFLNRGYVNGIYDGDKWRESVVVISKWLEQEPSIQPKPMQVELEGDGYSDGKLVYDYGKCPKCGWRFEYGDKDWEEPYCCHCGQRLKWFESEE